MSDYVKSSKVGYLRWDNIRCRNTAVVAVTYDNPSTSSEPENTKCEISDLKV
jgi:flagellar basal body P-ring protein FlgI